MPRRPVDREKAEADDELFKEKMAKPATQLDEQFTHVNILQERIRENLKGRGNDF